MRLSLSSRLFRVLKRRSYTLSAAALSALLLLSSCGGGSGGGGGATAVSGQAIDAPLTGATITVTLNAPEGQTGAQILGTTTADSNGNFTLTISFPNTSAPVFANAQTGSTVLSSYLGPASTLASLSTLSTTNVPNLAISQVTTAALAILAATNQLSSLTPTSYATLLSNDRSDILAVAAGIMAVADKYCSLPGGDRDTFEMGQSMVAGTSAVSSSNTTPTLTNVSTTLGNSCSSSNLSSLLSSLLQAISASQYWAPELDLGDVVENIAPVVPAGTYHLQGLTADTGISQNNPSNSVPAATPSPFDDPSVSVSSSGGITSKDGNVSGQITGNYLTLSLTTGGATTTYSGKVGLLPSGFLSSTTAEGFSLRTGGQDGAGNFVKFDAVLVPQGATPNWTGISGSSEDGTGCSQNTIGFRMHGLGPIVGGNTYNLCATTGNTAPFLTITNGSAGEDDFNTQSLSGTLSISMNTLTEGTTSYPFILTAGSVSLGSGSNGTLDYVMGANEMIYVVTSYNTAFLMNDNPLDKLAENSQNSDH